MKLPRLVLEYCIALPIGLAIVAYEAAKDRLQKRAEGSGG